MEFVFPTQELIEYLAENLRSEDVAEVAASSGLSPLEALMRSWDDSTTIGMKDGVPVLIFGVAHNDHVEGEGFPWMLATDDLEKCPVAFMKECRKWVDWMHDGYPKLRNFVDARNKVHIKWLKYLGFEFIKLHESFGVQGLPFWEFTKEKVN